MSLAVEDIKRISSSLTVLANEKQKASKPSSSGKKKGGGGGASALKTSIKGGGGGGVDLTNYDDVYDEFEDFM